MQNSNRSKNDEKIIFSAYVCKPRFRLSFTGPGRTKQSFKAECDINNIMARFLKTGILDFTQKNQPRYGDCTGFEYQAAMNTVAHAKTMFNELPAAIRNRFDNEPGLFLDFVQDPRNRNECEELGLLEPVPPSEDDVTPPGTPPSTPPATTAPHGSGPHARGPGRRGKVTEGDDAPRRDNDQTNSPT